jgi:hypothetical protein
MLGTLRYAALMVLLGVFLPGTVYLVGFRSALKGNGSSLAERLNIDIDTFDVETFQDTLSPATAKRLGLISLHPATEIIVVVVTSTGCAASHDPGLTNAVRKLRPLLEAAYAHRPDVVVRMVGVALDWDVRAGVDHLMDLADFDEVVSGGNRLNTATEKYLWGPYALGGGTPQVLILNREIRWSPTGLEVGEEELLLLRRGPAEIATWVDAGAAL